MTLRNTGIPFIVLFGKKSVNPGDEKVEFYELKPANFEGEEKVGWPDFSLSGFVVKSGHFVGGRRAAGIDVDSRSDTEIKEFVIRPSLIVICLNRFVLFLIFNCKSTDIDLFLSVISDPMTSPS